MIPRGGLGVGLADLVWLSFVAVTLLWELDDRVCMLPGA